MKYLFLLVILTILMVHTTAIQVSCKDIYRCTQDEYCLNGWCVPSRSRNGNQVKSVYESSSKIVKKSSGSFPKKFRCFTTSDCGVVGFGSVCTNGFCRKLY